jgi:hypothetical protein
MSAPDAFILSDEQDNDARLLDAECELLEWLARADAQRKVDASNSFMEPIWNEIGKWAETIHKTPVSTLIGAAVKLRAVLHPDVGIEDDADSENLRALREVLLLIDRAIYVRRLARRSPRLTITAVGRKLDEQAHVVARSH